MQTLCELRCLNRTFSCHSHINRNCIGLGLLFPKFDSKSIFFSNNTGMSNRYFCRHKLDLVPILSSHRMVDVGLHVGLYLTPRHLQCYYINKIHSKQFPLLSNLKSKPELQATPVKLGGIAATLVNNSSATVQSYMKLMRIDRPIGSWLLFWPCGWSIAMAAESASLPDLKMLALFGLGAFVMRGAGCTINDMWDKDIDKKVSRTKDRPLVTGAISQWNALVFLAGQLSIGLAILLQLNWYSVFLGASSLALVVSYPLFKRITYWPQVVLGMAFNWGALLGWSAIQGSCNWMVCLPLYAAGICWTIFYDTIYAHQDKADDLLLGIKSTAIKFGENTKVWLSAFGASMVGGLVLAGLQCGQTWPYYWSVSLVAAHLTSQLYTLNIDSHTNCAQTFISNHHVGLLLFLGIVAGTLLKAKEPKNESSTTIIVDKDVLPLTELPIASAST